MGEGAGVRSVGRMFEGLFILLLMTLLSWRLILIIPIEHQVHIALAALLTMWGGSAGIIFGRLLTYLETLNRFRTLLRRVTIALHNHDIDAAVSIAVRHKNSREAKVIASGLTGFQAAMALLPDREVLEIANRAMRRSANVVQGELKEGLWIVAFVAGSAPLVGTIGAVFGIIDSFPGCGAARATCMAATFDHLSVALLPIAVSLFVGVQAMWGYRYAIAKLEALDLVMQTGASELLNRLAIYLESR
jgi:biopolymer transport protein ExbB/TolQ